ncbi:MAG TPA: MASE1 domain-containing protein [Solirubrobacteraceae bacterium]|nr:MASE1 domain-containing protein [Solirubrobacteraceae bacterium]
MLSSPVYWPPESGLSRHLRYVAGVGAVGAIYWVAAKAGLQLAYLHGTVAALWPPVGVGMALLILYGRSLWPGIVLGDLAVADFSQPAGTVLGQTVGNTLEVLIAATLFLQLAEGRTQFGRVRDVAALVAAAAAGTAVSAVFGVASLRLGGVISNREVGAVWRTWFLGDLSGALVFAPLLLCWLGVRVEAISRRHALEGAGIAVLIVVLALLPSQRDVPYIVFPVLIWAALRGGPRWASGAVALVTTLTVYNTAHHAGPFIRATTTQSLLATQLFVAAAALTSLVLGAVIEERQAALDALRENERRLRDSRARIVKAGDVARRRLERNLHDGAQQRLVSVALTLRLAKLQLQKNPAEMEHLLTEASDELQSAIEELRELARGIHPAVLTERGLGPALEVLVDHARLPVELTAHIPSRLPSTVEAVAYYVAAEGLTNVAKYAHATAATVHLEASNKSVVLSVGDNGSGGADPNRGTGLRGLADRVEALGGRLELHSPPGQGTLLTASIPCER